MRYCSYITYIHTSLYLPSDFRVDISEHLNIRCEIIHRTGNKVTFFLRILRNYDVREVFLSNIPIKSYSIQEWIVIFAKWNCSTLRDCYWDLPTRSTLRVFVHAGSFQWRGAKEERGTKSWGSHAWQFLFNFSKVTENAFEAIKLLKWY